MFEKAMGLWGKNRRYVEMDVDGEALGECLKGTINVTPMTLGRH